MLLDLQLFHGLLPDVVEAQRLFGCHLLFLGAAILPEMDQAESNGDRYKKNDLQHWLLNS